MATDRRGGADGVLPLAFGIPDIWIFTVVLAAAGLALVTRGYVVAFRFDPNAGDPEPRKALGRSRAVWGEQLAELLATDANAEPNAAADRPREHGSFPLRAADPPDKSREIRPE